MNQRSFGALFGPYLQSEQSPVLLNGCVESMDMDHATRCMEVTVRMEEPMALEALQSVETGLAQTFRIAAVTVHPVYAEELFSAEGCALLVSYLKRENVAVNGTFEDARFELVGDEVKVYLAHGGVNILQTTGAERQLQQLIRRQYGRSVTVTFVGEAETQKDERYQKMMEQAEREAAEREAANTQQSDDEDRSNSVAPEGTE